MGALREDLHAFMCANRAYLEHNLLNYLLSERKIFQTNAVEQRFPKLESWGRVAKVKIKSD